tara:strand:+ start:1103 stop:1240 length:138 start_codon:yes stop_codon:yes gene_type:complete
MKKKKRKTTVGMIKTSKSGVKKLKVKKLKKIAKMKVKKKPSKSSY